jgi:hypothetical protein
MSAKKVGVERSLNKRFLEEVKRCLLLDDSEKDYWIKKIDDIPTEFLKSIYKTIQVKNRLMDKYVLTAVKNDPALLQELKNSINKIKKNAIAMEEKMSSPDADEDLMTKLKEI